MWCCIKLVIILTVCIPLVHSQAVVVTITKQDKFYCLKPYTFKCEISGAACCTGTSTRVWRKENVQIMSNGAELITSGKYSEIVSDADNYFTLTINNINDDDFSKDFVCSYSFYTSNTTRLNKDDFQCYPCWDCVKHCLLWIALGVFVAGPVLTMLFHFLGICICPSCCYSRPFGCHKSDAAHAGVYVIIYGTEYEKGKMKMKRLLCIAVLLAFLGSIFTHFIITAMAAGTVCDVCYDSQEAAFISVGAGTLIFCVIYHWTLNWRGQQKKEVDDSATVDGEGDATFPNWRYVLYVVLTVFIVPIPFLVEYEWYRTGVDFSKMRLVTYVVLTVFIVPIPFLFLYEWLRTGGKNQSVESGSSCWPICRVGQDPNTSSSDPEEVRRSTKKERADVKQDKKPTKVVRPQPSRPLPSRAQHLKTDNTVREEYSTENEMFKPRLLPSISGQSDSPRPLPQRTPDDQLEKSSVQLKPLGDSTSEKKKRRKKKKKEPKQSDEDDKTDH